ncbi:hypothetical protein CJF30_00003757 [Rutstroemia sp. NJR-2017a BBW]|nr:hypothetical protein CJF30_00003757 [Rutstroemia sp. NJR-2017a BBW]
MPPTSLLTAVCLFGLNVCGSIAGLPPSRLVRRVTSYTTPDDPTQTGTIATCNLWYDVVENDSCESIEEAFGITSSEFLAWNPAVSSDCKTNFWVGDSYCVGVADTVGSSAVGSTTTISSLSSTITAETTGPAKPTQSGQPYNCDAWLFGGSCISHLVFSVLTMESCDLSGLKSAVGTYSIIGNETSAVLVPIPTATAWPPTPTQSGILSPCLRYYQATSQDNCQTIVNRYSNLITMSDFLSWNPSIVVDYTLIGTTASMPRWINLAFPMRLVNIILRGRRPAFHKSLQNHLPTGDTCSNVTSSLGYLEVAQFEEWNSGADCTNLENAYYCVANFTSLPLPSTASVLPSPVQSGIAPSCTSWYEATIGDDCDLIPQYFQTFTTADLLAWNPALGSDCSGLVVGDYYCVAVPGTPTNPTTTFSATPLPTNGVGPQPEQPGIPSNCSSYWFVGETDNCTSIAAANGVTLTQLADWNPALGSDCSGLAPNYFICVGLPNEVTTSATTTGSTSAAPSTTAPSTTSGSSLGTPTPVQAGMVSNCERFYLVESGNDCTDIALDSNIAISAFYGWNPALNGDCSGLQANVYVCVGTAGPATTITSGNPVPATPSPTQTGMVSGCLRFYDVQSGDSCSDIALDAGISLSDFYGWNPAIGPNCAGLQAQVYVCIGISGQATTITSGSPVPATTTAS